MRKSFIAIIMLTLTLTLSGYGNLFGSEKDSTKSKTDETTNQTDKTTTDKNTDVLNLKRTEFGWGLKRGINGSIPDPGAAANTLLSKHSGYYVGDTKSKVIYLTFDSGYENGNTSKILDILKNNNVQAAFFLTNPFINEQKSLVKRMVDEGHIVGNHTATHPSMAQIFDFNRFKGELSAVEKSYNSLTGKDIPKFFRPPMGKYSELSLYFTEKLGYKSIFWSFAYADWDQNKQPSKEYAINMIKKNTHNGGIFLLHSVSKTNAEILDEVLKYWKSEGYELKTLNDLP